MNKRLGTLTASLIALLALPRLLGAQDRHSKHSRYILKDLGTLGGSYSQVRGGGSVVINEKGTVVGGAETSDWDPICGCPVFHAFKWRDGVLTDLGTLPGGGNYSDTNAINSQGAIVGQSANGLFDPLTGIEAFVATLWKNGHISDLGTFGGSFSLANTINDRGQIVGGAENTIPDPFDFGGLLLGLPSSTQWHAALWQNGTMQDLGTLGDGPDSFALVVNERGQVTGFSYTDSTPTIVGNYVPVHPFLWEQGRMVDLGTLGGVYGAPAALNNRGQVVGGSSLAGDMADHAFLWDRGKMKDLGTLGGSGSTATALNDNGEVVGGSYTAGDQAFDGFLWRNGVMIDLGGLGTPCSYAWSINSKGQIVGQADDCHGNESHAYIWEKGGPMVDLNTLVPPGSDLDLIEAEFISDRGEIAGFGVLPNGDGHAFLLIPREKDAHNEDTASATVVTQPDVTPEAQSPTSMSHRKLTPEVLAALRARLDHRYRGFGLRPPTQPD